VAVTDLSGAGLGARLRQALERSTAALWLRSVDRVGSDPVLIGRPHIDNSGRIQIGDEFSFASRPAPSHLVAMRDASLQIGDRVTISYGAAISSQLSVIIGDDTRIGPFVVIMDSDFHVAGDRSALAQPAPVRIGARVQIGSRVTILRGTEIGDAARVESGSVVSGSVPAGARVGGVPARSVAEASEGLADLPRLVARVLGLAHAPDVHHGPAEIPEWDSLGTLKLLLAIEDAFRVSVREEEMAKVRSIADLYRIVDSAGHSSPGSHAP
jgi:acetyltransferase-like isoleucine patch superfamily enzyme